MNRITQVNMAHNGKAFSPGKEQVAHYHLVVCDGGAPRVLAVLRLYTGRHCAPSVVYAACFLRGGGQRLDAWGEGHGSARGWGYYRPAVAAQRALESAGLRYMRDMHNEDSIPEALLAYGMWLGYEPENMTVIS